MLCRADSAYAPLYAIVVAPRLAAVRSASGRRMGFWDSLSKRQLPALAEPGLEELVGSGVSLEGELARVPLELAVEAVGDGAESHPLGVRTRDAEVRARWLSALRGADPVAHVARGAREGWRRQLVFGP